MTKFDFLRRENVINAIVKGKAAAQRANEEIGFGNKIVNPDYMMLQEILELPAEPVRPIVYSRWKDRCCVECGGPIPTDSYRDYISEEELDYCPYCGATMLHDQEEDRHESTSFT